MGTTTKNLTDLENLRFFIFPAYNKRVDSGFYNLGRGASLENLRRPPASGSNEENGVENDMKRKLMKAGAITLAIALFAACGSGDEPRNSTDAETETSRDRGQVLRPGRPRADADPAQEDRPPADPHGRCRER